MLPLNCSALTRGFTRAYLKMSNVLGAQMNFNRHINLEYGSSKGACGYKSKGVSPSLSMVRIPAGTN